MCVQAWQEAGLVNVMFYYVNIYNYFAMRPAACSSAVLRLSQLKHSKIHLRHSDKTIPWEKFWETIWLTVWALRGLDFVDPNPCDVN